MKNNKRNISSFNLPVLLLIIIVFLPSAFQFAHAFENHEQKYCHINTIHIHEHELDCSICDFNLNPTYNQAHNYFRLKKISFNKKINFEFYNFKYYHQQLSYSLRGPPELLT
jgi:hypothetical protein